MYFINIFVKIYNKISRSIVLWLQYLQSKKPKKIQQFQDIKFQILAILIIILLKKPLTAINIG